MEHEDGEDRRPRCGVVGDRRWLALARRRLHRRSGRRPRPGDPHPGAGVRRQLVHHRVPCSDDAGRAVDDSSGVDDGIAIHDHSDGSRTTEAGTVPATTEAPTASTDVPATTDETVPPSTDVVPSTEAPPTTGDAPAPGPDAAAIIATLLAAAPDTYGSGSLDDADAGEADTTFAGGRSFQCGDVVVYFDVLEVSAAAAAGSSTVTLVTDFDTSFSGGGTGFTDVAATLAIDDSTYAAGGNESLATDVTDDGSGALELTATVGGVDAGERIVVEYPPRLAATPPMRRPAPWP